MTRQDERGEQEIEVAVSDREVVADGVVRLTLRPVEGDRLPDWHPGAHLDLHLAEDLVRQYSLCGSLGQRGCYEVAVLRKPAGRGGSAFAYDELKVGATLRVSGPRNHFELAPSPRYLFLAGGIGITPIMPMVAKADADGADWRLVYGGRRRASMAFAELLLARYGERVGLHPQDEAGLLPLDAILGAERADTPIYCCGPEGLLRAVEEHCADRPDGCLHVERFAPKEIADAGPGLAFEVEFAESGKVVRVPPGTSIVDAAGEAGIDIETSCREGTCGTCESVVLGGEPDHRDSILSAEERAANDVMFPCVSRALSSKIVIDR